MTTLNKVYLRGRWLWEAIDNGNTVASGWAATAEEADTEYAAWEKANSSLIRSSDYVYTVTELDTAPVALSCRLPPSAASVLDPLIQKINSSLCKQMAHQDLTSTVIWPQIATDLLAIPYAEDTLGGVVANALHGHSRSFIEHAVDTLASVDRDYPSLRVVTGECDAIDCSLLNCIFAVPAVEWMTSLIHPVLFRVDEFIRHIGTKVVPHALEAGDGVIHQARAMRFFDMGLDLTNGVIHYYKLDWMLLDKKKGAANG